MLTTVYDFWCKFIGRWTAIVPVSHSIDEETGDILCGHSPSACSSLTAIENGKNKKMIEPPPLEWRTFNRINEMPEAVIHQKDCYKNSSNITNASADTDNNNLCTTKSSCCKSSNE